MPDIREQARPCRSLDAAARSSTTRSTSTAPASAPSSRAWPSAARLPQQIAGLYHAGSVGIIMSGWLGAMNYGVIVANDVDGQLMKRTPRIRVRCRIASVVNTHDADSQMRCDIAIHLRHRRLNLSIEAIKPPFRTASRSCSSTRSSSRRNADRLPQDVSPARSFGTAGHYPDFPLTPGVLLCEAAMQAGAVLLAEHCRRRTGAVPVVTRMNDVQFKRDGPAGRHDRDGGRTDSSRCRDACFS